MLKIKSALLGFCSLLVLSSYSFGENKVIDNNDIKELSEKINVKFTQDENKHPFLKPEKEDVKYEVVYFFSYGCQFCHNFDPLFTEWSKNVNSDTSIIKVPATFQEGWDVLANAYIIKENLKLDNEFDTKIFETIHDKKYDLRKFDSLRSYFINNYNVNYTTFNKEYNSFSTINKKTQYDKWADDLLIQGTPTILIIKKDGTVIRTSPGMTGDDLSTIVSIEYVLRQERNKDNGALTEERKEKPKLQ